MDSNKIFQIALVISLVVHGAIFLRSPNFGLKQKALQKQEEQIEVQYLKPFKKIDLPDQSLAKRNERLLKLPENVSLKKNQLPPSLTKKDKIFESSKADLSIKDAFTKPSFIKPEVIAVKTKITLSPQQALDKNQSPSYLAHSQIVREKIKRALYQNYNRMEEGQVFITFVLTRQGRLKNVRLIDKKSSSNSYLRKIALESVKDASPFPGFPEELDYKQLSFNVVISFEIE